MPSSRIASAAVQPQARWAPNIAASRRRVAGRGLEHARRPAASPYSWPARCRRRRSIRSPCRSSDWRRRSGRRRRRHKRNAPPGSGRARSRPADRAPIDDLARRQRIALFARRPLCSGAWPRSSPWSRRSRRSRRSPAASRGPVPAHRPAVVPAHTMRALEDVLKLDAAGDRLELLQPLAHRGELDADADRPRPPRPRRPDAAAASSSPYSRASRARRGRRRRDHRGDGERVTARIRVAVIVLPFLLGLAIGARGRLSAAPPCFRRTRSAALFVAQREDRVGARHLDRVAGDGADRDREREQRRRQERVGPRSMRASNLFSQSRITHQATGQAIRLAMITGLENCQASSRTMSRLRAPNTLRMPISLVRRSAVKAARPNRPRQAMITASIAKPAKLAARGFGRVKLGDDVVAKFASKGTSVDHPPPARRPRRERSPDRRRVAHDHASRRCRWSRNMVGSIDSRSDRKRDSRRRR